MSLASPSDPGPTPKRPAWSARLVLWHWLAARCCLLLAGALLCWDPGGPAFSAFHPTTLAAAHLLALGFVATSIAGAFPAVAGMALRVRIRTDWRAWVLLLALFLAATGVASHLWLGSYPGIAWSGAMLVVALLLCLPEWWLALVTGAAPWSLRAGVAMAWLVLLLAACFGAALAVDRTVPFLPSGHHAALVGHAHLAIGGFACGMAVSLGLRLLPMFLPAAPPGPVLTWCAVSGTLGGALWMGVAAPLVPSAVLPGGLLLACGIGAFLLAVLSMLRRPRPAPRDQPRPDPMRLLMLGAVLALLLALGLGLLLLLGQAGPGAMVAYGALGLLGFPATLAMGLGGRLLPLIGWHAAWHDGARGPGLPAPPRSVRSIRLGWCTALCWLAGVGLLCGGALFGVPAAVALAGAAVAGAALTDTVDLLRGFRRRGASLSAGRG